MRILREDKTIENPTRKCVIDSEFELVDITFSNKLKAVLLFLFGRADILIRQDKNTP